MYKKALALAVLIAIVLTVAIKLPSYVTIVVVILVIAVVMALKPQFQQLQQFKQLEKADKPEKYNFENEFLQFRVFNPDAYNEAHTTYLAFFSMQQVAGSYQLYTNAHDLRTSCINALKSIVVTIDTREYVNALMNSIAELDIVFMASLKTYREHLNELQLTTSWRPLILLEKDTIQPYIANTDSNTNNYNLCL